LVCRHRRFFRHLSALPAFKLTANALRHTLRWPLAEFPMSSLKPWQPSRSEPWNRARAAHLLNRAGFGGALDELAALTRRPVADAIAHLVHYDKIPDLDPPIPEGAEPLGLTPEQLRKFTPEQRQALQKQRNEAIQQLKIWWIRRMAFTPRPLQEKMTLFWHGHFATSAEKVRNPHLMHKQNETFRQHATGNFRDLVLAVCKDPAMCEYLDGNSNRSGKPNENFARELMELFTLGEGNYTEQDVKESARAFTGWGVRGEEFLFRPAQHDHGIKNFLGQRGNFDGSDIVRIIFEQPAVARFLCKKLWQFFAYENPEPEIVEGLADIFRRADYELKPVLAALFASKAFWSAKAIRTQIKSPVQLVVGSMRLLQTEVKPERALTASLRLMGQDLFFPPSVKGWDGGKAWINTSTLLARQNFANAIVNSVLPDSSFQLNKRDPTLPKIIQTNAAVAKLLGDAKKLSPDQLVDTLADALLHAPLPDKQRQDLIAFAAKSDDGKAEFVDLETAEGLSKLKQLVNLIMSSAAFQLG
jgi:hypothetical protein